MFVYHFVFEGLFQNAKCTLSENTEQACNSGACVQNVTGQYHCYHMKVCVCLCSTLSVTYIIVIKYKSERVKYIY